MSPTKLDITRAVVGELGNREWGERGVLMGQIGYQVGKSIKMTGGVEGVGRRKQAYDFDLERTQRILGDLERRKWRGKDLVFRGRQKEIIGTAVKKLVGNEEV